MSIQHLIDNGSAALAAFREQAATAKATADRIAQEDAANRWRKELSKLHVVLPVELHSYVGYDATQPPSWRGLNEVWIDAIPGCIIRIFETDHMLRFYPQKAVRVVRNYYSDGGNAFRVEYENAYYDGYVSPLVAIAHAVELAPANLEMEADAEAQGEATAAKEAIVVPSESELTGLSNRPSHYRPSHVMLQERHLATSRKSQLIHAMIYDGKPVEAIARALLLIAKLLEDR